MILTIIFAIVLILLGTTNSKAILQANPTTHKSPTSKNGATWITEIRQMETANQTMGLNETLNGLNATSASNGIDVHMMLPTEYGAVAILSASGYGNPKKLLDETNAQKRTTTGNSTGIYFTGDRWELTASFVPSGAGKYVTSLKGKVGAYGYGSGIEGWHGASTSGSIKYPGTNGGTYTMSLTISESSADNSMLIMGGQGLFRDSIHRKQLE